MMDAYCQGYHAAGWGILSICNPWPFMLPERTAWAEGHHDAIEDCRPRVQPRLQAEFEEL